MLPLNFLEKKKMADYKLDRTAFKMYHTNDAKNNFEYWRNKSVEERLKAANYLNSISFNFPINEPPKLERNYFKIRTRK
jgi:hypothetical protein